MVVRYYNFIYIPMGNFFLVPVNYLAVLLGGVINMALGYLWYGPLYGKEWVRLTGITPQQRAHNKETMTQRYTLMFLASLVTAYVLFHFIWYAAPGAYTFFIAVKTALWAWVGLVFPISLTKFLFSADNKPAKLLCIETGYHLVGLILMAAVFYLIR